MPTETTSAAPITGTPGAAASYKGIGVTVTDRQIGDSVTVEQIKVIPVGAAQQAKWVRLKGDNYLLAKVKIVPGKKTVGGMNDMLNMYNGPSDSIGNFANDSTFGLPDVVAALKARGYPLATIPVDDKKPVEGWVMFENDPTVTGPIRIVLHRQAVTLTDYGLNGGGTHDVQLAEKDFPVIS
ncbi:MAG: hypothetical protein ACJ72E_02160 [Marmoricola sp.]